MTARWDGVATWLAVSPADALLIWTHVAMYGEFKLNMNTRLTLGSASPLLSQ